MRSYPWSLDQRRAPSPTRRAWLLFIEKHLPGLSLFLMILTLIGAVLYPATVVSVPTGHVGVLWKRFGGGTVLDPDRLRGEGFHIHLPWDEMFLYDLRLQVANETYNAISKDGVNLNAAITLRFRLNRDTVPRLHQALGPDYMHLLVLPEIGNRAREVISQYSAEEVYSKERTRVQSEILARTRTRLGEALQLGPVGAKYVIELYDVLVLGIDLPPAVIAAVNRKVDQFYIAEEYDFRLIREEKESERKRIEAGGIEKFQEIVSRGISESYLRWRGIEATLQLAQSSNAKVVIVGGGKDGLPIILGNVDAPPAAAAPPPSGSPPGGSPPALPPGAGPSATSPLPSPALAASTSPSAASAALSAGAPAVAGVALQSPAAVGSQIRQATTPAGVNLPEDTRRGSHLATPSTATGDVHQAFVPPIGPAPVPGTKSGAVHPAVPDTSPPRKLTPEIRAAQPPP
jgi:regulator of protease activity HflC (stomatin/prohibitin superfamily)